MAMLFAVLFVAGVALAIGLDVDITDSLRELNLYASGPAAAVILIGTFVVFAVTATVVKIGYLRFNLTRHACATLSVTNPAAFEQAVQSAERGPDTGEGLADAFDVGAF